MISISIRVALALMLLDAVGATCAMVCARLSAKLEAEAGSPVLVAATLARASLAEEADYEAFAESIARFFEQAVTR